MADVIYDSVVQSESYSESTSLYETSMHQPESSALSDIDLEAVDLSSPSQQGPKASNISAVFNLSNLTIGAGTLAIPYGISECGVLLGVGLLILLIVLAEVSIRLLVWTATLVPGGAISFQEVAVSAYSGNKGRRVARFVDLAVFLMCFSVLLAYVIIIGDLVPPLLKTWGLSGFFSKRNTVMASFICLLMGPLSLARTMDFLKHTSMLAMFCMLYVAMLVIGWAVDNDFDDVTRGNLHPEEPGSATPVLFIFSVQIFYALPLFSFAFASHTQVYQIYHELADKSISNMMSNVHKSLAFVGSVYLLVGTFGYFTFYDAVDGNLLNNYTDESNTYVALAKIGLTIVLVFSAPLFLPPVRYIVYRLWLSDYEARHAGLGLHFAVTLVVWCCAYTLAVFVPNMSDVLALTGATCCSCIMYIFPSSFYLALEHRLPGGVLSAGARWRRLTAYVLLVWGLVIGSVGTIVALLEFFDGSEDA